MCVGASSGPPLTFLIVRAYPVTTRGEIADCQRVLAAVNLAVFGLQLVRAEHGAFKVAAGVGRRQDERATGQPGRGIDVEGEGVQRRIPLRSPDHRLPPTFVELTPGVG